MKLTSPAQVRSLWRDLEFAPSSRLGQNFLIDANILRLILDQAAVGPADTVLEIGPGFGVLTVELLARARRVVAVEIDARLHEFLRQQHAGNPALELIRANALDLDLQSLVVSKGINKIVANLPYSSGTRMLMELVQAETLPEDMVLTLQREVAERLQAGPGTRDRGLVSVWAQAAYDIRMCKTISATCFVPRPKVASAFVHLRRQAGVTLRGAEAVAFRRITRLAFQYRRKQLATIFRMAAEHGEAVVPDAGAAAALAGIDLQRRPEDLSVLEWRQLARATAGAEGGGAHG